jgi:hypothetical protein
LVALAVAALLVVILLDGLAGADDHSGALRRAAVALSTFAGWIAAFYVVWWLRPASSATTDTGGREIRAPAWRRVLFFAVLSAPGWGFGVAWIVTTRRDSFIAAVVWVALAGLMAWVVTADRLTLTPDGLERSRWVPRRSVKWAQVRKMEVLWSGIVLFQPDGKRFVINNRFLNGWPEVADAVVRHVPPAVIDASGGREILETQAALMPAESISPPASQGK